MLGFKFDPNPNSTNLMAQCSLMAGLPSAYPTFL